MNEPKQLLDEREHIQPDRDSSGARASKRNFGQEGAASCSNRVCRFVLHCFWVLHGSLPPSPSPPAPSIFLPPHDDA